MNETNNDHNLVIRLRAASNQADMSETFRQNLREELLAKAQAYQQEQKAMTIGFFNPIRLSAMLVMLAILLPIIVISVSNFTNNMTSTPNVAADPESQKVQVLEKVDLSAYPEDTVSTFTTLFNSQDYANLEDLFSEDFELSVWENHSCCQATTDNTMGNTLAELIPATSVPFNFDQQSDQIKDLRVKFAAAGYIYPDLSKYLVGVSADTTQSAAIYIQNNQIGQLHLIPYPADIEPNDSYFVDLRLNDKQTDLSVITGSEVILTWAKFNMNNRTCRIAHAIGAQTVAVTDLSDLPPSADKLKVIPTQTGRHVLTLSCYDNANNLYTSQKELLVVSAPAEGNQVECFSCTPNTYDNNACSSAQMAPIDDNGEFTCPAGTYPNSTQCYLAQPGNECPQSPTPDLKLSISNQTEDQSFVTSTDTLVVMLVPVNIDEQSCQAEIISPYQSSLTIENMQIAFLPKAGKQLLEVTCDSEVGSITADLELIGIDLINFDLNDDLLVDQTDLEIFSQDFQGCRSDQACFQASLDINNDGELGQLELEFLQDHI